MGVTTKLECELASKAVDEATGAGVTTSFDAARPAKGALHGSAGGGGALCAGAFTGSPGLETGVMRLSHASCDAIRPGERPRGVSFQSERSIARAEGATSMVVATGFGVRFVASAGGSCFDADAGDTGDVADAAWICPDDLNRSAAGALQASSTARLGAAGVGPGVIHYEFGCGVTAPLLTRGHAGNGGFSRSGRCVHQTKGGARQRDFFQS